MGKRRIAGLQSCSKTCFHQNKISTSIAMWDVQKIIEVIDHNYYDLHDYIMTTMG